MKIKSQKDFFSGLMFMVVGISFAWGATTYSGGSGARMGPGYFPLLLGVMLAIIGAVVSFKALVVETSNGDKIGAWAWKPLFFIISANLLFGTGWHDFRSFIHQHCLLLGWSAAGLLAAAFFTWLRHCLAGVSRISFLQRLDGRV